MEPLEVPHMGTPKNPIKVSASLLSRLNVHLIGTINWMQVFSLDTWRIVGCTGFPVDSHDTLYGKVTTEKGHRWVPMYCAKLGVELYQSGLQMPRMRMQLRH